MSTLHATGRARLTAEARSDIDWFVSFLTGFNGITMIRGTVASDVICVDACPRGLGGVWWGCQFYGVVLPQWFRNMVLPISSVECYNVLVALRLWAPRLRGKTVLLYADNWATVCAFESGRAQDPLIRAVMREAWQLAAVGDFDLVVRHLPGVSMGVADALSRRSFQAEAAEQVAAFVSKATESEVHVDVRVLVPPISL